MFYEIMQKSKESGAGHDSNRYGVEVGIVTNVKDPQKLGRIKVQLPRLPGGPESDWARVAQPAAGAGRGFYWLPEVGDEVLIAFELGQANRPYVIGTLWNGKDKPMAGAYADDNTTRMIQTKSGTKIDVGTNFSLKVDADASIKASGNLKLKASRVNIN